MRARPNDKSRSGSRDFSYEACCDVQLSRVCVREDADSRLPGKDIAPGRKTLWLAIQRNRYGGKACLVGVRGQDV